MGQPARRPTVGTAVELRAEAPRRDRQLDAGRARGALIGSCGDVSF
jgi:hypothetical protein